MRFFLSGNLMRFSGFQREVEVDAPTVESALDRLCERHPALREVLLDNQRQVRGVHKLFLNGEPVDSLQAAVRADSEIAVVTAIAGG